MTQSVVDDTQISAVSGTSAHFTADAAGTSRIRTSGEGLHECDMRAGFRLRVHAQQASRAASRTFAAWASSLALLVCWAWATQSPDSNRTMPSPGEVIRAFSDLNAEGLWWPSVDISVMRVAAGLVIGVLLGVPAGVLSGASSIGHAIIDKPIHMLRAIPFPALAPLLIVLLGIGETMKIALIAIGAFALIYINVRDGVRNVDPRLLELARAYHLPKRTVFTRILLRGALPQFLTGLRFALTVSWIALVTCETVNASAGIGYILSRSQQFYRTDQMVLCIAAYAVLGLLSEWVVGSIERIAVPLRASAN